VQADKKRRALTLAGMVGALAMGGFLGACSTPTTQHATLPDGSIIGSSDTPPAAPREFRAAWVSTVANIDWPSKQNLNAAQQQAEAIAILDRAKLMNLNAIVLQVRPSADAIYASTIEPWSEYLTGAQGKPPQPWYDPLKFWVTEAHARGLELHAWFNPYRARHDGARSPAASNHITRTNPAAVKRYGKFMWMDPGEESASKQTLDVILDVVRRYDIDGVHLDDYFYPYPIEATPAVAGNQAALDGKPATKAELDFPDTPAWERYLAGGGRLDRASWRRQNVDHLIEDMYKGIHREKSWVRFGISPFGLGRPDRRPPGIAGFSQYDKLYADAELWLQKGWLDYFTPQLYWARSQKAQSYDVLLDYWIGQNTMGRHIWPVHQPDRRADQGLPAAGDPGPDQRHPFAPAGRRPRALQHGCADAEPQGHRRPIAHPVVCGPGAGAGHALAGQHQARPADGKGDAPGPRHGPEVHRRQGERAVHGVGAPRQRMEVPRGAGLESGLDAE